MLHLCYLAGSAGGPNNGALNPLKQFNSDRQWLAGWRVGKLGGQTMEAKWTDRSWFNELELSQLGPEEQKESISLSLSLSKQAYSRRCHLETITHTTGYC